MKLIYFLSLLFLLRKNCLIAGQSTTNSWYWQTTDSSTDYPWYWETTTTETPYSYSTTPEWAASTTTLEWTDGTTTTSGWWYCDRPKAKQCDGCKSYNICLDGNYYPSYANCPADAPYCKVGSSSDNCAPLKDPNNHYCKYEPERFNCIGEPDMYPDPLNCKRFFFCVNPKSYVLQATMETCPEGYYYNSKIRDCARQVASSDCYKTSCAKGAVQVYTPDPQFYIVCYNDIPLMNRCPNFETYDLEIGCHYQCTAEGRYVHEDPYQYYYCYLTAGETLTYEVKKCAGGYTFNTSTRRCNMG